MKRWKKVLALAMGACLALGMFAGCSQPQAEKTMVNVAALSGPTGIGMTKLVDDAELETTQNRYAFTFAGAPDEIVGKLTSGEVDIAAVPINLAATLNAKTNGNIQLLALNTLGVLYIVEDGDTIHSLQDLSGKTIYATGQGSTPEYVLSYILEQNGLTDVTVEYQKEHADLAAMVVAGNAPIALLPEPFVTTVTSKKDTVRVALDVTEEWQKATQQQGQETQLAMGCIVVRREFAEQNPDAVQAFLSEYAASVQFVNDSPVEAAKSVAENQIMPDAQIVEKAIPNCNIVCITGQEMKTYAQKIYEVLYEANPQSVGGALPADDFYYVP